MRIWVCTSGLTERLQWCVSVTQVLEGGRDSWTLGLSGLLVWQKYWIPDSVERPYFSKGNCHPMTTSGLCAHSQAYTHLNTHRQTKHTHICIHHTYPCTQNNSNGNHISFLGPHPFHSSPFLKPFYQHMFTTWKMPDAKKNSSLFIPFCFERYLKKGCSRINEASTLIIAGRNRTICECPHFTTPLS